ncbi:sugar transferase [Halobaculum gomorrense]|uniref:Sugar transferase involved in LPS biosynthesis (Colanic, teichoic acid) n=1 Tax=Halobaculum gomorrense TaxID=43928 RepID=A0A1M5JAZ8_9EURY|nr:sugar transferase [Halobaculum gomorrense]SHG37754.1 Sugar transferase involved in LPS biosynthesis (colanic, teichoic acid) [Halobaculum gomorrense]
MERGWRYRLASVGGVILLSTLAVAIANHGVVQSAVATLPLLRRLPAGSPDGPEFAIEVLLTVVVFTGAFFPLYRPRPRRVLDTVALTHKRVIVAVFAVATIGYFDYTYALPRLTVLLVAPVLFVALPAWFVWIRQRPNGDGDRTIVVGDDPDVIADVIGQVDEEPLGYLCPTNAVGVQAELGAQAIADGGVHVEGLARLGGLSRIEDVLVEYDVDTVVLAFEHADRAEFFGALDACYEHGVDAKVHRDHSDTVLTSGEDVGRLVDVQIEPWDIQDYMLKRAFDVAFSGVGLVVLLPVILGICVAIKVDDGGSVLYKQERTAVFGERFDVYKFRSMVENAEATTGVKISAEDEGGVDPRVTRVGRVLRQTHLDEIPQLWAVLWGDMSVVGPRPERPAFDFDIQSGVIDWRKRWFVKPGLTGVAQVRGVTGADPQTKIRYDLQYVKKQSFWYDLKLIVRQVWKVGADAFYIFLQD